MGLWKVLDSCRQSFISTTYLQPVNVAFVDVTKAFDPVSDHSLLIAAARLGVPPPFLTYLSSLYGGAQTVLRIGPERSSPSNMVCGVRHGDPLSPHLFNALIDWVIDDLEPELGVLVGELRVDCGAFANHVVLFASSPAGFHWGSLFDDLSEAVPAVRIGTFSWIVRQVSQSMHRCRWWWMANPYPFLRHRGKPGGARLIPAISIDQVQKYLGVPISVVEPFLSSS